MTEMQFIQILKQNEKNIENLRSKTDKVVIVGAGNTLSLYEKNIIGDKINV